MDWRVGDKRDREGRAKTDPDGPTRTDRDENQDIRGPDVRPSPSETKDESSRVRTGTNRPTQ